VIGRARNLFVATAFWMPRANAIFPRLRLIAISQTDAALT
jgi:hypothetical protein